MLTVISGAATLGIVMFCLLSAWLSTAPNPWQYYLWAGLAVILWGQPWNLKDPLRTDSTILRSIVYGVLLLAIIGTVYVYQISEALIVFGVTALCFFLEYWNRMRTKKNE